MSNTCYAVCRATGIQPRKNKQEIKDFIIAKDSLNRDKLWLRVAYN